MQFVRTIGLSALLLGIGVLRVSGETIPRSNIADLFHAPPGTGETVCVEGMVTPSGNLAAIINDATGSMQMDCDRRHMPSFGDIVRVRGSVVMKPQSILPYLAAGEIEVIRHETPPTPANANPASILRGEHDFREVVFEGVVTDVFVDELGPAWSWLLVEADGVGMPVAVRTDSGPAPEARQYVDAEVQITGVAAPDNVKRPFLKSYVCLRSTRAITIRRPPPADPFTAPEFTGTASDWLEPRPSFAHRRRVSGRVTAAWHEQELFLRMATGKTIRVRLAAGEKPPPQGSYATAAGFIRTDSFYARLDNALVRLDSPSSGDDLLPAPPQPWPMPTQRQAGPFWIDPNLNGQILKLRGTVLRISAADTPKARIDVDIGGKIIPIELGRLAPPPPGAQVEVAGACVIETKIEDAHAIYSRITGFSLVPRCQNDIRIIHDPPWWTRSRLFTAIGILVVFIAALIGRNAMKVRQSRKEVKLRLDERTRLAVELHDSLAQHLTGVSLQLDAAELAEQEDHLTAARHLDHARKALQSCREELKFCLGDLRQRSFEDANMTEAIQETIRPHAGQCRFSVRFNVPRTRLSDSSAHAVLCIVRELTVNAVRHGRAGSIFIAGEFRDGHVRFSVRDDGCGFDPHHHPGPEQGHFGLLGVRERVNSFNGSLKIERLPHKGMKIVVIL